MCFAPGLAGCPGDCLMVSDFIGRSVALPKQFLSKVLYFLVKEDASSLL